MREHKVKAGLRPGCSMPNVHSCFNELLCDITALGDNWHDHRLRGELLWRRSKTLSGFFKAHAANERSIKNLNRMVSLFILIRQATL
ncbi:Hypothetical protein, putative [Bodo saltans]|uniref:Uncharacterized protein n=1 Tax=Bodo saltans TaxID=75058 RepID=A0A0S4JUB2_BODSA|nr:Hypothetical protein, putative [Bodo saltans]|eukprot:CUG92967.1 Hypothetical protein, putative [Bodo saltans]